MSERKLATTVEREARADGVSRAELIHAVEVSFLLDRDGTTRWMRRVLQTKRKPDEMAGAGLLRQAMERAHGLDPAESWRIFREIPKEKYDEALRATMTDRRNAGEQAEALYREYLTGGGFDAYH